MLLPSALWQDLPNALAELSDNGLPVPLEPFREFWDWRFPILLGWRHEVLEADLEIRAALEPWPLICDTQV